MYATLVFGAATVFITRWIFSFTHPDYFVGAGPTISRTAAFAPSGTFFTIGMCLTSVCAALTWFVVLRANVLRPRVVGGGARALAALAVLTGWLAALFLALLSIVDSNWNGPLHEKFSIAFYASQVLSFALDTVWQARFLKVRTKGGARKTFLFAVIFVLSAVFLGLYLVDKADILASESLLDAVFVPVEYVLSLLCFAYAAALRWELTDYDEQLREHGTGA